MLHRKKLPKRKLKNYVYTTIRYFVFAIILFCISLGVLALFFTPRQTIISPVSYAFSQFVKHFNNTDEAVIIKVKEALQKNHLSYTSISVDNEDVIIALENGEEVILSKTKDIDVQIASLQLTISHLTIEGKHISRIDLRFDRPVVVFQ